MAGDTLQRLTENGLRLCAGFDRRPKSGFADCRLEGCFLRSAPPLIAGTGQARARPTKLTWYDDRMPMLSSFCPVFDRAMASASRENRWTAVGRLDRLAHFVQSPPCLPRFPSKTLIGYAQILRQTARRGSHCFYGLSCLSKKPSVVGFRGLPYFHGSICSMFQSCHYTNTVFL